MFIFLFIYIIKNLQIHYIKNTLLLIVFVFFSSYNLNFSLANDQLKKSNFSEYKKEFNKSVKKTYEVKSDITLYIEHQQYANIDNLYWLTPSNNNYYIDIDKIKKMTISDLDIDNEFLVFLYLYVNSSKIKGELKDD